MSLSGAELLAKSLSAEGVDRIYGIHGGHTQPLFDALPEYDIELIGVRDERAGAHMAHAHYQATGEIGVATATAGPGITNAATGVANAYYYHLPMLLIGGCESVKQFDRRALQGIGQKQTQLYEPITKWAGTVFEAARFPEYVDTALKHAFEPRPGPSYLNVPMDVLQETVPDGQLDNGVVQDYSSENKTFRQRPDPASIEGVVSALQEAERPIVMTGVGVVNSGVTDELDRLLNVSPMPYLGTAESAGFLSETHPLNMNAARSKTVGDADLVLLVGKSFDFGVAYGSDVFFDDQVTFVQMDADPREIGRNRPIDVPVVGNEAVALQMLTTELRDATLPAWDGWIETLQSIDQENRDKLESRIESARGESPVHPWRLCGAVQAYIDSDAYVACEGGDILSFGRIALGVEEAGHYFQPGPFGCLGAAVPSCIATALLEPDRQVVGVIGDGSFGFSQMELETAARYGANVTFFVANNAAWNGDRLDQVHNHDHVVGTELSHMRYDLIAESVGGHGEHVQQDSELDAAVRRAIEFDGPAVVNTIVQRDVLSPDYQRGMHADEEGNMAELHVSLPWESAANEKRS